MPRFRVTFTRDFPVQHTIHQMEADSSDHAKNIVWEEMNDREMLEAADTEILWKRGRNIFGEEIVVESLDPPSPEELGDLIERRMVMLDGAKVVGKAWMDGALRVAPPMGISPPEQSFLDFLNEQDDPDPESWQEACAEMFKIGYQEHFRHVWEIHRQFKDRGPKEGTDQVETLYRRLRSWGGSLPAELRLLSSETLVQRAEELRKQPEPPSDIPVGDGGETLHAAEELVDQLFDCLWNNPCWNEDPRLVPPEVWRVMLKYPRLFPGTSLVSIQNECADLDPEEGTVVHDVFKTVSEEVRLRKLAEEPGS